MEQEGTRLVPLSPHAALLLQSGSEKILIISDLHIGWEVALAQEGVHVPSQTPKFLRRLEQLANQERPDRLLVLGDVKHTVAKIEMREWHDVPSFLEEAQKMIPEVQVMPGNHDGNLEALLPEGVEILPSSGTVFGDVGFFHGHTWPDLKLLSCTTLVIGHVHPVVAIRDPMGFRMTRQVWVKASCDGETLARFMLRRCRVKLKTKENPRDLLKNKFGISLKAGNFLVMPSFNDFLGGRTINRSVSFREKRFRQFISPVLRSGSIDLAESEICLLDGTFLGTLEQLRALS